MAKAGVRVPGPLPNHTHPRRRINQMATTQPADQALKLERIEIKRIEVPIEGVTPLIAHAYRLRIVDSAGERTVRYWTNVIREDQHVYKRTQEVVQIETLRQQRRLAIMRDLNRIRGELATFDSLGEALTLVDDALARMRGDVK